MGPGRQPSVRGDVERTLDQELGLVRDAITLVARGASRRVVVANLRFGDQLLARARQLAREARVRVVPLWMPDDSGADIAVEALDA
jgi:hypothetical protein